MGQSDKEIQRGSRSNQQGHLAIRAGMKIRSLLQTQEQGELRERLEGRKVAQDSASLSWANHATIRLPFISLFFFPHLDIIMVHDSVPK